MKEVGPGHVVEYPRFRRGDRRRNKTFKRRGKKMRKIVYTRSAIEKIGDLTDGRRNRRFVAKSKMATSFDNEVTRLRRGLNRYFGRYIRNGVNKISNFVPKTVVDKKIKRKITDRRVRRELYLARTAQIPTGLDISFDQYRMVMRMYGWGRARRWLKNKHFENTRSKGLFTLRNMEVWTFRKYYHEFPDRSMFHNYKTWMECVDSWRIFWDSTPCEKCNADGHWKVYDERAASPSVPNSYCSVCRGKRYTCKLPFSAKRCKEQKQYISYEHICPSVFRGGMMTYMFRFDG
jgi:hypothetical protein